MKTDNIGFSGPEIFFIIVIILLVILSISGLFLVDKVGPEDKPYFLVQKVYLKEQPGENYQTNLYLTNRGTFKGEATIKWKLTRQQDILVEQGEENITIDGRSTDVEKFDIGLENDDDTHTLIIEIYYNGDLVDTANRKINR